MTDDVSDDVAHTVAQRVKMLRDTYGLSQREVAKMAGLSLATVSNVENAYNKNAALHTVHTLARTFGVSISMLVGEVPLPDLPVVKVVAVHVVLCSRCGGRVADDADPDVADKKRRAHVTAHFDGKIASNQR